MRDDAFERHLDRFAANPLFRGIRPRSLDKADFSTPPVLEAAELLAERDLQLDFHMGYDDMEHLARLADAVPQLRIVINHIGAGRPIDGIAPNPAWADVMRRMASRPKVFCKVSAVLQHTAVLPAPEDLDFYRPTLDVLWDAFGEDRLIYGSNWPNVEQIGPYSQELAISSAYFREKGDEVLTEIPVAERPCRIQVGRPLHGGDERSERLRHRPRPNDRPRLQARPRPRAGRHEAATGRPLGPQLTQPAAVALHRRHGPGHARARLGEIATSGPFLADAPLAIAILMEGADAPELDAGRAIQQMELVAWEEGLGTCFIGLLTADQHRAVKDLLGIPNSAHLVTILPFGYRARTPRSKRRRPLSEIAHDGHYGVPFTKG